MFKNKMYMTSIEFDGVDPTEAPEGFIAIHKDKATTPNVCNSCDARTLCNENIDDWCLNNRCTADEMVAFKDRKTYKRKDGKPVIFKQIITQ